jgi:hypothetical protein
MSKRGQAHKVDEKWMTPYKQDGVSPVLNSVRLNLRTMFAIGKGSAWKLRWRNGWALNQSEEKVRELQQELEDEKYEHLLSQEALMLRMKKLKQKDKDSLMQAERKQHSLHDLIVAAELGCKDVERRLRFETSEADKAIRRCETLEAANEAANMAL